MNQKPFRDGCARAGRSWGLTNLFIPVNAVRPLIVKSTPFTSDNRVDARGLALDVLSWIRGGDRTLDDAITRVDRAHRLDARDRAFMNALVFGVLRWRGYLDFIIDHFSKRGLGRVDPNVLDIIRIGLFQMVYLDRVPPHAAVNTSVEMAKQHGADPWVAGFVNALLKNAAKNRHAVSLPDPKQDPVKYLSISRSFPKWMIDRWIDRMGYAGAEALCDAVNTIPSVSVRTNTLKTSRDVLMALLVKNASKVQATGYAPDGVTFFSPDLPIPRLPGFSKGWFQIQDEAAQLITLLLAPRPGERIMDACAGLGGKTGHVAQMMQNAGEVVALDRNSQKLTSLEGAMKRLGVSIVSTRRHRIRSRLSVEQWPLFDRVLLDAPCSGMGVIRRNPDIKWRATGATFQQFHTAQVGLMDSLAGIVKPGGILVYAVCTTEPEETVAVVEKFLAKPYRFKIRHPDPGTFQKWHALVDDNGFLKTDPQLHGMDGFFAVAFQKASG